MECWQVEVSSLDLHASRIFSGMVSICAGCNLYEPWAAAIVAIIAGILYVFFSRMMLAFKVTSKQVLNNFPRSTTRWTRSQSTQAPDPGVSLPRPSSSRLMLMLMLMLMLLRPGRDLLRRRRGRPQDADVERPGWRRRRRLVLYHCRLHLRGTHGTSCVPC